MKGSLVFGAGAALGLGGCGSQSAASSTPAESFQGSASGAASASPSVTATESAAYNPQFDLEARTVMLNNGVAMPVLGIGTYILSSA